MLITLGLLVGILIVGYLAFVNLSPQFGGDISREQQAVFARSANYKDGKFVNDKEIRLDMSFRDMASSAVKFFRKEPGTVPERDIAVKKIDSLSIAEYEEGTRLIWFGHSAFLLQMDQKNILIDPMFGSVPAPHPLLGTKRFSSELPIAVEKLPEIDAVIISHDHYDHLDYGSIKKLKDKVNMFYTPLGVGTHLKEWGIEEERIIELDWWEETGYGDLIFRCTPARHFSGRKFNTRESTLWSSWIIESADEKIFFSGDSGYGPHFKEIGDKYGPFDFAMMECGQYNELWPDVHMFPEETAQAGADVKAKYIMPIHWGAFKLAFHPWTEPVDRVIKKAKELEIPVVSPEIGEPVVIDKLGTEYTEWWK
ncbi:MBL fold metallo-hydrolase [Leptobacterium flavescens]|uniref:MBL fold metallo-hydrolase n=1 Tax=Leptobacterium flavescens TaxID=472055 RepID=A0A6P0UPZ7_9FLAO|nr:MBL fold metallo-hydrolase [Leptobacterium flavescens]NER12456.1 MBL fold metallo-hydrolase [Leptobacterium flavescens]